MKKYKRTIVVGFDAGTWDVLKPLAKEGKMPNVAKLLKEGASGDLRSTIPPYTGPAWAAFATGCNPGKTGVFDFTKLDPTTYEPYPVSGEDFKKKTYYEHLSDHGKRVIMVNFPMAFPEQKANGILIGGFLRPSLEDAVSPRSALDTYDKEFHNYKLYPIKTLGIKDVLKQIRELGELERNRFELARAMFKREKWDHFFVLFSGSDWIAHKAYGYFAQEGENEFKKDFIEFFSQLDSHLGFFMDNLKSEDLLLLISDHGAGTWDRIFFADRWLMDENYAGEADISERPAEFGGMSKEKAAKQSKLAPFIVKQWLKIKGTFLGKLLIPLKILVKPILTSKRLHGGTDKEFVATVNRKTSQAFFKSPVSESIYINDEVRFANGRVISKDVDKLRKEISFKLAQLKDPETGEKVFTAVYKSEDIYRGPHVTAAPDIILRPRPGLCMYHGTENLWGTPEEGVGGHREVGIFAAYGKGVREGYKMKEASLLDVAPTILYAMGVNPLEDQDGEALKKVFS